MLTDEQIITFCNARALVNGGLIDEDSTQEELQDEWFCQPNEVAMTRETIEDFIAANGKPVQTDDYFNYPVHVWSDVQTAKGKRRGDLVVMDFGDARAAHFSGEV